MRLLPTSTHIPYATLFRSQAHQERHIATKVLERHDQENYPENDTDNPADNGGSLDVGTGPNWHGNEVREIEHSGNLSQKRTAFGRRIHTQVHQHHEHSSDAHPD